MQWKLYLRKHFLCTLCCLPPKSCERITVVHCEMRTTYSSMVCGLFKLVHGVGGTLWNRIACTRCIQIIFWLADGRWNVKETFFIFSWWSSNAVGFVFPRSSDWIENIVSIICFTYTYVLWLFGYTFFG